MDPVAMKIVTVGLLLACLGILRSDASSSEDKVAVDFYSESLCPYCSNFVVNYLSKFMKNGVIDIVDLRIIPYGNAHIYSDGQIICQHGEDECKLNLIQTCAIKLWPRVTQWFPFILCLEKLVEDLPRSQVYPNWESCVEPSGLSFDPIQRCFEGPLGDQFEREFAAETARLNPPHKYVPWVVVNGAPLYESFVGFTPNKEAQQSVQLQRYMKEKDYEYIEKVVCQAYEGPKTQPLVCEKYSGAGNIMIESAIKKEDSVGGVCRIV